MTDSEENQLLRKHLRDVRELLGLARRYVPEDRKLFADINVWLQITEVTERKPDQLGDEHAS